MFEVANGGVEGSLGKFARLLGRVEDLIEEDRVVQSQSESAGMGGGQAIGFLTGYLVGFMALLSGLLVLLTADTLSKVAVVVALHLEVKHLGFRGVGLGDQVLVQQGGHVFANLLYFSLNLGLVGTEEVEELRALGLFLLLDGRDGSPGGPPGPNPVLIGNAQKVTLLV